MRAATILFSVSVLAGSVPAQDPTYYEFLRAFEDARQAGDRAAMVAAVRRSPDHAMTHFVALCWDLRVVPEDQSTKDTVAALKVAWTEVHETPKAMDSVEQFVVRLTDDGVVRLREARQRLQQCLFELSRAERFMNPDALAAAGARAREEAELLEGLGDAEYAADAWGAVARALSLNPDRRPEQQADLIEALQRFVRLRESWGWVHDLAYAQNVAFLRSQTAGRSAAPEAVPYLDRLLADAEETVAGLEFEMLGRMEPDMFVRGGPVPTLWDYVRHTGEVPVQLPHFTRGDLFLVRLSAQRFGVTTDVSSGNVTEVQTSARPRPSLFHLGADRTRPYAMWFFTGGTAERFMESEINLLPTRDQALVFYRSAASWKTSMLGEDVVFYDDNCDGRLFVADPFAPNIGMRTLGKVDEIGIRVPAWDSMRIGRGPRIPYSEAVRIEERWYRLRGLADGTRVGIRPLHPELLKTGGVELAWTGNRRAAPELLIIQGRGGLASTAFDIASGDPVEVPAGDYEVSFGRIVVGSGDRTRLAQIFKGESEPFTVEAGTTVALEMGAPFRLEFEREGQDPEIAIDAAKMRVLGVSGAQYATLHGAVPAPDVVASVDRDGRGAAVVGGFTPVVDPELALIFANRSPLLDYSAITFPRPKQPQGLQGDLVFRLRLPASGMVVGLRQDRHPLFGRLEPVFK